jgi:hypothetical protein
MLKTKQDWRKQMKSITKELAKLEKMNWAKNDEIADSIFPYVLVEAINLLLNAQPKEEKFIKDWMATEEKMKKVIEILTEN